MENETVGIVKRDVDIGTLNEVEKFFSLRNDYMFHMVFQSEPEALKALVAAFTGIETQQIGDCAISNPIEYGDYIDRKAAVLDIKLNVDGIGWMDLEMQNVHESYWIERTLYYWAKAYTVLGKGELYRNIRPVTIVSILDFTLFPEHDKFFAQYEIRDKDDGYRYSDKLSIKVLDLKKTENARTGIDEELCDWARMFQANSWAELEEAAKGREVFEKMAVRMKQLTADEKQRMYMEMEEDYYRVVATCYADGFDKGEKSGFDKGEKSGFDDGFDKGEKSGFAKLINAALQKLDYVGVANLFGMSEEEVKEYAVKK